MGKFTFTQTEIPGVVIIEPEVFGDDRGYFWRPTRRPILPPQAFRPSLSRTTRAAPPGASFGASTSRSSTPRASWSV